MANASPPTNPRSTAPGCSQNRSESTKETRRAATLPTVCIGCGRSGKYTFGRRGKPRWCRCKGTPGPLNAAPGTVTRFTYETADESAFRERGRLIGNAYIEAKDALTGCWVRRGKGWQELPRSAPKRQRLDRVFASARRALLAFQRSCSHPTRSMFEPCACDVCHKFIESDATRRSDAANDALRTEARRQVVSP
jgi:hypothetical protein